MSQINLNRVLRMSVFAGKMVLENGGETYRAEDTITTICNHYRVSSDCFATLTGIMVSITKEDEVLSTVIRIKARTINLEKIHQINDLSRHISNYSCEEFMEKLQIINSTPRYSVALNFIAYCIGAASFSILFGGNIKDFFGTLPIGGIVYLFSYSFSKYELNGIFVNTIGGAISAFLAYYFHFIGVVEHTDKAIIGSLMLLVPGIALTNSIRDIIAGDYMAGMARGTEALLVAISLAVGTGAAISFILGGVF